MELIVFFAFYFIPLIVGAIRKVPNIGSVLVINLFLGWTVIGWIVALAMAARSAAASTMHQQVVIVQAPAAAQPYSIMQDLP